MGIQGHKLWVRLQKGFRRAVEKIKNEEMKMAYLSHGLQHLHHITFLHPVCHVTYDSLKKVFVVLDTQSSLHLYREDGFYLSSRRAPVPMTGLLYASQADHFVAWEQDALCVLDSSFKVLSEVHSAVPICCGIYSELLHRIVTAGDSNLTVWGFRYGSRTLQCRATVSDGLGTNTVFHRLALDTSGTEPQRCFAACETGAAALNISSGALISFQTKLHSREITDIAYCDAAGSPVTASRDTTIKIWDETWHIRTVFVGHTAPVIAVASYPQRPLIFSASQDGTIRTWNLDTVDQVDQVHVSEPVEALETQTRSHVISISGPSITLWKINKLYSLYAPLGSPVKRLCCVDLTAVTRFPVRIVCVGQDSTVRVLDAATGEVLSVLALKLPVLDVAYCLPRETLFVLVESGSLLRVNSATDPMIVRKSMPRPSPEAQPSCLLLYSQMDDPEKAFRAWLEVVAQKSHRKSWQKIPLKLQDKNRYVLIVGQEDGLLCVVEWFTGRIECQVEAHASQRVTALAEYPAQTSIISAGESQIFLETDLATLGADRTVKMWRVFPYAEESLVLLLSFSCAVPAWHLCCLDNTLAVAFQDPETVTYSIVHYDLMKQTRREHGPEDDPMDDITGLCCCPNLKLFASASRDGSVKIWNSQNQLLRHLKLNTIPASLAFANPQGDLLVGIERHLYRIHHQKYLPSYYNMTLLCAKFLEPVQDTVLPITQASLEILIRDNVQRLKEEPPSVESESPLPGVHAMFVQESKVIKASEQEKKASPVLDRKSLDLQQLQMGTVRAAKKVRFTKAMREEAFEQYLQVFRKEKPKVEIPEEDTFNADEVLEALSRSGSVSALYGPDPSNRFLGVFPELASLKVIRERLKQDASSSVATDSMDSPTFAATLPPGVKPALSFRLQGQKKTGDQAEREVPGQKRPRQPRLRPNLDTHPDEYLKDPATLRAPPLGGRFFETIFGKVTLPREKLRKQLSPIQEYDSQILKTPSWPGSLTSSTVLGIVDADRSQKNLSSEEALLAVRSRESDRSSRFALLLRSQTFSRIQPEASRDRIQAQMGSGSLLLSGVSSGFIPNSVFAQQWRSPEYSPSSMTRSPEEQRSPSLSISSAKSAVRDQEWGKEKATSSSKSTPKESSSRVFLTQLDESHYPDREVTSAEEISAFHSRFKDASWFQKLFPEDFPAETDTMELLGKLLAGMPAADFSSKTQLLGAILSLRAALEPEMRSMIHTTLIGLLNAKKGAPSMKEETQRRFILAALRALLTLGKDSRDLMVELMTYYLQAPPDPRSVIERLIEETGVKDPHRYFFEEMDSWQVKKGGSKKELRKVCWLWLEKAMQAFQEHQDLLSLQEKTRRRHSCSLSPPPKVTRPRRGKGAQRSVHPADAVNYFVGQKLERKMLEDIQELVPQPEELPRDTVMALPPIRKRQAILRLGETNTMLRNRIPEHFYFPYIFPRYLLKGFVPFVKLALPKINLSPFPSVLEMPLSPETFTARQQLVQKYFIPKFSYADSYP